MPSDFQTIEDPIPMSTLLLNQQSLYSHSLQRYLNCLKARAQLSECAGLVPSSGHLLKFMHVILGRAWLKGTLRALRAEMSQEQRKDVSFQGSR